MKSAGSPPPAPDPTTSANAQSHANVQTAIANARLNRVNQTTPWGSISYTQTGTDENGVPIYSSQIALSPQQQALLEQQQHGQLTRSQLANSVLSNGAANISRPLDLSGLHSVYDAHAPGQSWAGNPAPPQQAAPAPMAAAPVSAPAQASPSASQGAQPDNSQNLQALIAALRAGVGTAGNAPAGGAPATASTAADPATAQSAGLEQFHYDPSKPIEPQIKDFLKGRNPYGQMSDPNWFKDPSLYQAYSQPDESGTQNTGYRAVDPRLADITPGAVGPEWNSRIIDNRYTPVGWSASKDPAAVNGLKPDSMYDYGKMYYDPRFGLVQDGNNVRDPSARHDAWYGAALMSAVAGPAIAGIMGGAGAAAGAGESAGGAGTMTGAAGDESLGLAGTGTGPGAGAGASSGGLTTTNNGYAGLFQGEPQVAGGTSGGLPPVTDLSVNAQQPTVWQQMMNNMQNGKGLLGMNNQMGLSTGQRAGVGAGASLLSRMLSSGQGSKK